MRFGFILDTLTSVDFPEVVKTGGKVIGFHKSVIYRENFKISPFRKVIEKLFDLGQKNKGERNGLMQSLIKLIMNNLYGVQIRKDIFESYKCISQNWMETEYDDTVLDNLKLPNGKKFSKSEK